MPLPKLPKVPPAPQEGAAVAVAQMINSGMKPAALVCLLQFDADAKELLQNVATLTDPADLITPFRNDPVCWQHLKAFPEEKLLTFAAAFIAATKERIK